VRGKDRVIEAKQDPNNPVDEEKEQMLKLALSEGEK